MSVMTNDKKKETVRGTRPRRERIEVWVTTDEKAELVQRAAMAGLSQSAYMLAAGMNHPIRSVLDLRAVGELAKVNGDLGRVAGLLKLWLAEKRGQGARPTEAMMRDFRKLQDELTGIMSRAVRGY